jgi:hypothetical protein
MMNHPRMREKKRACAYIVTSIQQMAVPDSIYFAGGTEQGGVDVSSFGLEENELEILLDFAKGGNQL